MKAVTLQQPWAGLIIDGVKDIENRNFQIDPQRICIHAGLKWWDGPEADRVPYTPHQRYAGEVIGTVKVVKCVPRSQSRWASANWRWHWVLEDPLPLRSPVPWRGRVSLWDFPDECLPLRHLR